jgi:hypothetical protein
VRFHQKVAARLPKVLPELPSSVVRELDLEGLRRRVDSLFDSLRPHLQAMGYDL